MSTSPNGNFGVTLGQRLTPSVERFNAVAKIVNQALRVALPAVVQSFTVGPPPTVNVQVATNEFFTQNTGDDTITLSSPPLPLPLLQNLPIMIVGSGGFSLTFPIKQGDECLVLFADTPLDVWLQNGGTNNNPITQRRHSLSDGIAIFGLSSKPNSLSDYNTTDVQLRSDDGTVLIDLSPTKITITAPTIQVTATTQATVTAPTVNVNTNSGGTINITGPTPYVPVTSIDGKSFLSHFHSIPGGSTGPVVTP